MIDFVKFHTYDFPLIAKLHGNDLLEFSVPVGIRNGEILVRHQEAEYYGLKFKTYDSGRVELSGSLHKYWNKGVHNYNDFSFKDLKNVIMELQDVFGVDPHTSVINNFEFGVNIAAAFCIQRYLNCLISCKDETFTDMDVWKGRGKHIIRNNYYLKHYDKGLQYQLQQKILRIEIAIKRMAAFHKCDKIQLHLIDFLDPAIPSKFLAELQNSINHTIFDENFNNYKFTISEREVYDKIVIPSKRPTSLTTKQRFDLKTKFNRLIENYGTDKYRQQIHKLLLDKFNELNNLSNVLTGVTNVAMERFDRSNTGSNHTLIVQPNTRVCKTCGRDISKQKNISKYCSELLFGKQAKKCRNSNSNPKNNLKNKLSRINDRGVLFPIEPFLKVNELFSYTLRA